MINVREYNLWPVVLKDLYKQGLGDKIMPTELERSEVSEDKTITWWPRHKLNQNRIVTTP